MKIKATIVDTSTGKPLGYGVTASIVKAGSKKGEPLGPGYLSDDVGVLEIDSKLLDYDKDNDAVDIEVSVRDYETQRFSPEEFTGEIKLKPTLLKKAKDKAKVGFSKVPPWAWISGGLVLGVVSFVAILGKNKK